MGGKFTMGSKQYFSKTPKSYEERPGERGGALLTAIIISVLLAGISVAVLASVTNEVRIAHSDTDRTRTFYAAAAGMEKMTSDFSALFTRTSKPTQTQLNTIAASYPSELTAEGFTFSQTMTLDTATLTKMQQSQNITDGSNPFVQMSNGPFAGLRASITPYKMTATSTQASTGIQVGLEREMNNYLIPLFQFGMFSDKDIELHPGPPFVFNGRIHTNGNLYLNGDVMLRDKVTVANELVYDVLRNNSTRTGANVRMVVNSINVALTMGSVKTGPNLPGTTPTMRGYHPGSPDGTDNSNWKNTSVAAAKSGRSNQFGGQLLTRSTGSSPLLLPLQLGGNPTRELIKRSVEDEVLQDPILNQSRYHTKAQIRILIDDEGGAANAAGIPAGQGVDLSTFDPMTLGGGKALIPVNDSGNYTSTTNWTQGNPSPSASAKVAETVRGIRSYSVPALSSNSNYADPHGTGYASVPKSPNGGVIPPGAGIQGRILIQIVDQNGVARDVTREILSMGMTEGEPNGIVYMQRPLWAVFMQGNRDRDGGKRNLEFLTSDATSRCIADGEINSGNFSVASGGYYNTSSNSIDDDSHTSGSPFMPTQFIRNDRFSSTSMNRIVPINVYNPREGWIDASLSESTLYERGLTSVIELNMRNLARWADGVFDGNLLAGTNAVSANIDGREGYIIYVSDRRGDKIKDELDRENNVIQMTNGTVDNEDIYGPNGSLDPGEDVLDAGLNVATDLLKKGTLQKDETELPDPTDGTTWPLTTNSTSFRRTRAETVSSWTNPNNYFRRAVRLFNGHNLQVTGGANKLSTTKGISVATENMVYIWGSYNTSGIGNAPSSGTATLNDGGYRGNQIPASIVADAFFPLSKTWSDAMSAMYPEGGNSGSTMRTADVNVPDTEDETSVRAAIIAGTNMSALSGDPDADNDADSRLSGGMHNFPRFLENWLTPQRRWNFVGSFCPLYYSTQALGPWIYLDQQIYGAPSRNWAFDTTFRDINRLPPGTPMFQYIEATGFRQVLQ
jgi:Tfp pilus assembly protein PilX